MKQLELLIDLNKLSKQKAFYESELKVIKMEERMILGTYSSLEKFGREKYLMKKEGETVFYLVEENGEAMKAED
jgi:cell division protein DivIC